LHARLPGGKAALPGQTKSGRGASPRPLLVCRELYPAGLASATNSPCISPTFSPLHRIVTLIEILARRLRLRISLNRSQAEKIVSAYLNEKRKRNSPKSIYIHNPATIIKE